MFIYWKIALELLMLWYVIYMILLFVKGTRTEQLLKGLVVIGVIFIVTQQMHLDAINWLLTRLFPISVIALVIIFQPELRRGLTQLGRLGIHQENVEIIDEVARAAANLSKKRIGAIVVIEREVGLKSYIESGVMLDSRVSGYLIGSIFLPQSPLHDGAVIIRGGRLVAAGCVLPLPQEEKSVSRSMGMRHRAAIGISEETDAVCVVVSEETGAISIAHNGRIASGFDEEGLVKALTGIFKRPARKKTPFQAFFRPVSINTKNMEGGHV